MMREAAEILEKNSFKKSKQISADELIPMWMYVLINSDINNIMTECVLMQEFRLKDQSLMNESDYHLTNVLSVIDLLNKEDSKTPKPVASSIQPYVIYSGGSNSMGFSEKDTQNQVTQMSKSLSQQPKSSKYVTPGGNSDSFGNSRSDFSTPGGGGGGSFNSTPGGFGTTPDGINSARNETPFFNSMTNSIKSMMKKNDG